ncbi:hypothetical protein GCM10008967_01540 [Bacillus carboniphilus]|uniref:RNA helicase n=1 Tax=Bacillus carboniphilus TaxID=86663 RepID=A0ABN0VQH6_9BACI
MDRIDALYNRAIDQTKTKVYEDINRYLGSKEEKPSFEEYLRERTPYIIQIWLNIWLNLTNSHLSKNEKKSYLEEAGYEVEGIAKKALNQIFRNEMRESPPFQVTEWLENKYAGKKELWAEQYVEAREKFIREEEERIRLAKRHRMKDEVRKVLEEIIKQYEDHLYLWIRYKMGIQISRDIEQKGYVVSSDYTTVDTFLDELSEPPYQNFYYEENGYYYEIYERYIMNELFDFLPRFVKEKLPLTVLQRFKETFHQELSEKLLRELLEGNIFELSIDLFEFMAEEYITDLIRLSDLAFDLKVHQQLFEEDMATRERRREEELAEIKRKQEEEKRMLEDIFSREYSPSVGKKIHYILHVGETNTGKTHHALERMKAAKTGLYLAPLRLLALEIYDKLNNEGVPCSLKTGEEEKINPKASHISCTVEMFHEKDYYDVVVIDEAQMIADKDRGFSWYKAITQANAKEVHIVGSFNMKEMVLGLIGDAEIDIHEYTRDIPLEVEPNEFSLKHTKKGDALVCFSRRRVLETASDLQKRGKSVSMIYGSMPPETRKKQIQRFINGETSVVVSTDAIGMGVNLPIRRIVFLENEKFDGTRRRRLTSQEVKQIAGRAGRKGIYEVGKVAFTHDIKKMSQLLHQVDEPLQSFTIAPTSSIFERFQKYSRDLGLFFELWEKFKGPKGTRKASLDEERELYETIRGTMIEARFSLMDLYGFLHLPFSPKDPGLKDQWVEKMVAIVERQPLPEPRISKDSLEQLELSYKSIGLHLLFLYRLEQRTEALYWERIREEISDDIHEVLKKDIKADTKKCKKCGRRLPHDFKFPTCNSCHREQVRYRSNRGRGDRLF